VTGRRGTAERAATDATPTIVDLDITAIAAGGDGVARHEGLVVFVPRTAPGDRVRAEVRVKGRFAQGRLRAVLDPSPSRVPAPCLHYERNRCGGCQLQHLSPDAQLAAKSGIVRDAIVRIGKRHVEMPVVRASPALWRYRNKLTLAMRRRGSQWLAGLHPYDAPGSVFAIEDCPITAVEVLGIWRAVLEAAAWLPDEPALRGAVRSDAEGSAFVVEGGTAWPQADRFFEAVPELGSLWWTPDGGTRQLLHTRGNAPASPSFAQVNPSVARELRAHVLDRIGTHAPSSVVDAYAGDGGLAVELEVRRIAVTTIELDADAVAQTRARLASGTRVLEGRVEDLLGATLPVDLVVLNPPRTGLHERIPALLNGAPEGEPASGARPTLIYVSCNPATLARDIARLPSYRIASVAAFDMFPQTAHVETVCELIPEAV
jgi:23S rRNA (uracil1939-C5)-methyltransferase